MINTDELDPWSKDLTTNEKLAILARCKNDAQYFLNCVIRPRYGDTDPGGAFIKAFNELLNSYGFVFPKPSATDNPQITSTFSTGARRVSLSRSREVGVYMHDIDLLNALPAEPTEMSQGSFNDSRRHLVTTPSNFTYPAPRMPKRYGKR